MTTITEGNYDESEIDVGGVTSEHWRDGMDNPAGGITQGVGLLISWQHGALGRGAFRRGRNGAFVEDVIAATIDRLQEYQSSKFKSTYNQVAIDHLNKALGSLEARTADREDRDVEGTHKP